MSHHEGDISPSHLQRYVLIFYTLYQHAYQTHSSNIIYVDELALNHLEHLVELVKQYHSLNNLKKKYASRHLDLSVLHLNSLPRLNYLLITFIFKVYISKFCTYLAFSSINSRRGSTLSPIKILNISSAAIASFEVTCNKVRESGLIVVSHNCSAFISPKPLYRCKLGFGVSGSSSNISSKPSSVNA